MKIAIASEGEKEDSKVCPTAGRAPYYLIFEDGKLLKKIKNPFAVGGGGAGFGVAKMLENEKVDLIISGQFGGNMLGALKEKGIKTKEMQEKTVKQAIKSE